MSRNRDWTRPERVRHLIEVTAITSESLLWTPSASFASWLGTEEGIELSTNGLSITEPAFAFCVFACRICKP
ncbi:hypothetical protein NDU88_004584 [Pleurodeles waltl]|uniref:Uncharacterized protein n=1 Tax=Pleurodeles waltl TaxID=8319 RepID=A0AAV7QIR5_PLEWA|nr:hypothetical protein NDU88_004584 [Pleurodeles waltl]